MACRMESKIETCDLLDILIGFCRYFKQDGTTCLLAHRTINLLRPYLQCGIVVGAIDC